MHYPPRATSTDNNSKNRSLKSKNKKIMGSYEKVYREKRNKQSMTSKDVSAFRFPVQKYIGNLRKNFGTICDYFVHSRENRLKKQPQLVRKKEKRLLHC